MLHGKELNVPSAFFVKKLETAEKLLENQESLERIRRKDREQHSFTSPLTSTIKFDMRYKKQVSVMKDTLTTRKDDMSKTFKSQDPRDMINSTNNS